MLDLQQFMLNQPVAVFFLVLSVGYLVGAIKLFGLSLGPVGGVLLAGLLFGHLGFSVSPNMQTFGFAVFIFCVGYQAGPRFFDVLMTSGFKFLSLALVVATTGFAAAALLGQWLELAPGLTAGLLGGAMTTTPTLAAAQDAVRSGLIDLPADYTAEAILTNIGAGYALTYLFGLIGLIVVIRLLPALLKIDLPSEAAKLMSEAAKDGADLSRITRRIYRVTQDAATELTVGQVENQWPGELSIVALWRNAEPVPLDANTQFELGDDVLVIGNLDKIVGHAHRLGEEITVDQALAVPMTTAQVVLTKSAEVGKPVKEVRLEQRLGVIPLEFKRQRTVLPLSDDLVLHRGDVITVYGPESAIERLAQEAGHVEREVAETDLFTFALGIAGGIGIGTFSVTFGEITIGLGMAGGLLLTGLVIGFLRSISPTFGRVPEASRWVLMELGLLMFMAGVGINSGSGIVDIVESAGLKLIGAGILVTLLPVFVGYFFSTLVLRLNPAEALGGVTGSMTSGAALSVVTTAAKSDVPALGYTGAYAFANVILTLAGTVIMLL